MRRRRSRCSKRRKNRYRYATNYLFTFGLATVFSVVAFKRLSLFIRLLLSIVSRAPRITINCINKGRSLAFCIFTVSNVQPRKQNCINGVARKRFFAILNISRRITCLFNFIARIVLCFRGRIRALALFMGLQGRLSNRYRVSMFQGFQRNGTMFDRRFAFKDSFRL